MLPLTLAEVNVLPVDSFQNLFKNVVENAPNFAEELSNARPFNSVQQMIDLLTDILTRLGNEERAKVLKLYPDLADRARETELSPESSREHTAAGLEYLGTEQSSSIAELRLHYRSHFGFPFVVCARDSTPESIIDDLLRRLSRTREEELEEGIKQVSRISALRILDLVTDNI